MKEDIFLENGLYYRTNDFQPERQTLVFIHGLTGTSSAWEKYEKRFENNYNILTFDLRGHGKSKKFPKEQDYKVELFAKDLSELINYLHIKNFVLISHSFGTIIALEFLRQHAHLVRSAIFINPIHYYQKETLYFYFMIFVGTSISLINLLPFYPKKGGHVDYTKYSNTGDFDAGRLAADIFNTSVRIYFYCLRQIYRYDHQNFWSKLQLPVLIVHGQKDKISPLKNATDIADMTKDSKLVVLPNANHISVLNNFEEVSEAIEAFVSKS